MSFLLSLHLMHSKSMMFKMFKIICNYVKEPLTLYSGNDINCISVDNLSVEKY